MSSSDSAVPSTSRGTASTRDDSDSDQNYKKCKMDVADIIEGWNITTLNDELGTREQCISFAEQQNLVLVSKKCRIHHKLMTICLRENNVGYFVCQKGSCKYKSKVSRAKGTWFENAKIDLVHVFYLMYSYAHHLSHETVKWEDILKKKKNQCLFSGTISDWYNYCREAVILYQLEQQQSTGKIGGPGKVVQIDESKFGKRKYNKGRHIEGHWVLGMIEDGQEDLRLEVCPDNDRSAKVLVPLIKKHVKEGTTIHTDCWRAYDCLSDHGFIHKIVNHSDPENPFIAEDGTHTQRIESQWRVVKGFFYKENYNNTQSFADIVVEYLWRRNIKKSNKDPFVELMKAVKHVYKINNN